MTVTLHHFLSETSIHGLRYWGHSSLSRRARAFWIVITLTGCCMTFVLLFRLISDWSTYPTYTTIDSSAIPIETVPFPSVTVCQGDGSGHPAPSGGWGFIRKALDRYKLYYKEKHFKLVKTEFGKEFEVYLNFTGNLYLEKLMAYLRRPDTDIEDEVRKINSKIDQFGYDKYSALGKQLLCDNFTEDSIEQLKDRVVSELGSLFHGVVQSVQPSQVANISQLNCYEDIEPILIASYHIISNTRYINEFGTLVSIVAPLMGPGYSFKSTNKQDWQECDDFGQLEMKLHELFVEMSSELEIPKVGTTNRSISLFELPALLESNGRPFSSIKSWMTQHPHYSCQLSDKFPFSFWYEELPCVQAWENYILNGERFDTQLDNHANNNQLEDDTMSEPPIFPCDVKEHECCPLRNAGEVNLTNVMNVMKFANRRGQSYFDSNQLVKLLPMFSNYEVVPTTFPSLDLDEKYAQDMETYIPYCTIARFDNSQITSAFSPAFGYSTCMAFTPIVTNKGICYGFNSMHPNNMLSNSSQFYDSLLSAYAPEIEHHKDLEMAFDGQNGQGLTFYLDKQRVLSTDQFEGRLVNDNGHFSIAINTVLNSFNVKSRVTQARMGHRLEILVTVNKLTVSKGVRSLPIDARKCRLTNEVPETMTVFSYYTQDLCQFECSLKYSRKKCGCTPWHYPFKQDEEVKICDHYGKYCFEYFLQDQNNAKKGCDCLPDCERLTYSFTEKEWPLDVKDMCSPGKTMYAYTNAKMKQWAHSEFYNSLNSLLYNGTVDLSYSTGKKDVLHNCERILKEDLSVIEVRMAGSVYERSQIRLKQTFADKVSGFGGTLGLFVGASFITLVEVCYWVAKMLLGCRGCHKGKKIDSGCKSVVTI